MNHIISLEDLAFTNKKFWYGFMASAFCSIAYDEETDQSLDEIIEDNGLADIAWWDHFTGYYDGVIDDADGYVDDPCTFRYTLTPTQTLKVEFHPGDIVYYVNDRQIGCTGGEYQLQLFPFSALLKYVEEINDNRIFLLLLPLTIVTEQDIGDLTHQLSSILGTFFYDMDILEQVVRSIVHGLTEE